MRDAKPPEGPPRGPRQPRPDGPGEAPERGGVRPERGPSPGDELLEYGDGLIELDRDWVIVRVNAAQERTTGKPRTETLGRVYWEVWPEVADPRDPQWIEYHRCMQERIPVQFESYYAPLETWFAITAYPTSTGGIAVFFRDVTVQKRAELALRAEHAFTSAVLDTVANLVIVLDRDGTIVRVNDACERATGYAASELIGKSVFDVFIGEDDLPGVRETFRQLRAGQFPTQYENRWRMKDGSERTLEWNNTALAGDDGEVKFIIGTGSDVTEARRTEERMREAQAALRSREEDARTQAARLEAVLDAVADGLVVYDRAGRTTLSTRAADELLGIPPAERGAPVRERVLAQYEILDESGRALLPGEMIAYRAAVKGETVRGQILSVRPLGGTQRWLRMNGVPFFRDGRHMGAVLSMTDITERKRAEDALRASEAKFRSVFEQAAVGMGRVRFADARWIDVNGAFCRMLGRSRDELLRLPWPEITHPDDVELDLVPFRKMAAGELDSYTVEKRFIHAAGHHVWAKLTLSLVRDDHGRPDYEVAIIEDVGDRKRAEGALREANAQLREADRRKDEFLGMLSHELRNPLAPIRNSLYILDRSDPAGPQAQRAREVAKRQVGHMTRLVDDLLDVTRIARGKSELRRADLDLAALARRTAEDYRALMIERGLTLTVEVPDGRVIVNGDETRLAQVLGNLLSNAAKFTPAGGRVLLSVEAGAGRASVAVHDTGPGVPPEVLPTIFDPFTQAKQTLARTEGGLGLGLALVKGLVELHGGSVAVASPASERGTRFTVTLPLAASAPRAPKRAKAAQAASARKRRVMVVDDNRDAADSLAGLVAMLGHDADVAYDADAALGKAAEELPDVVLCDLGLPGVDGYELARQLRVRAGGRPVRLVAVSGYAQPEDVSRAIEAGFDAHVAKPADPEHLAALLDAGG